MPGSQFNRAFIEARGRERPDYTTFTFPAATVTDTAAEEVEIDQALSLAGRFGREYLGSQFSGILGDIATEHLTIGAADHFMSVQVILQTRTGAGFTFASPELLDLIDFIQATSFITGTATDAFLHVWNPAMEGLQMGEAELYVAPRLFQRLVNNIDASITANAFASRIASVSIRLTFELFVELLERFADVTLL